MLVDAASRQRRVAVKRDQPARDVGSRDRREPPATERAQDARHGLVAPVLRLVVGVAQRGRVVAERRGLDPLHGAGVLEPGRSGVVERRGVVESCALPGLLGVPLANDLADGGQCGVLGQDAIRRAATSLDPARMARRSAA